MLEMANCCWSNIPISTLPTESWVNPQDGWVDVSSSGSEAFFSGQPRWLSGEVGILAWRVFTDALSQYVLSSFPGYTHDGNPDRWNYARSFLHNLGGGIHPVAVFVAPDGYIAYHQPLWNNKFFFSSALDYQGDLNTEIPRQLKEHQFYQDFIQARNAGFPLWPEVDAEPPKPESTSELDIDINLSFVRFNNLLYAGYSTRFVAWFMTQALTALHAELSVKQPRRETDLAGVVTPVIVVKYETWLSGVANQSKDVVIDGYAKSAGPAPNVRDASVIEGLNRLYPVDTGPEVGLRVFDKPVDWTVDDFEDALAVQNLIDMFDPQLVHEWSPPDGFLGGVGNGP